MKYGMEIVSIVIYTGYRKMNMNNLIQFNGNNYSYRLIDIRNIDPELFLQSGNPKEIIFAMLAGNNQHGTQTIVNKIFIKLQQTINSEYDLRKCMKELQVLSSLRSREIHKIVTKNINDMPIVVDKRRNILFQEAEAKGIQKGTNERNKAFVLYLLQHTQHSTEQIADLVNVPVRFVTRIKNRLKK